MTISLVVWDVFIHHSLNLETNFSVTKTNDLITNIAVIRAVKNKTNADVTNTIQLKIPQEDVFTKRPFSPIFT